jgi:tetratricopeptide (TPR) repeat protein
VVARVDVVSSTEGTVRSLGDLAREEVLEKLTAIERGKSYLIIGRAHDHIGLRDDALDYFRRAQREFQYVLDHVPPGSDEEAEALQMSWKTHLEQANYNAAFATCLRILKSGRDTSVGVDALFRLATEVEQKNPRQAALYYRKLVDEFPRNPVAAQAQYRLAAARKREGARNPGLRSECASEFQRLIELFPDSEHVPEALSFVTQHALDTGDYERALDFATRLSSSYAATSFVEEGVMAQGKALLKLGRAREASALFKKALFDNPEARGELEPLLQEAEAKLAAPAESAATKEKK